MTLGRACLLIGFAVALYGAAAALYGVRSGRREWITSGRRAFYVIAGLMGLAVATLEIAYINSDFSFALVAQNSSTTTPLFYRVTALWSSQGGSLLLWVTVLSLFSASVLFATRNKHRDIAPYANAVLGTIAAFFLGLMVFIPEANPFLGSHPVPVEGNGLSPLLRHPSMMFHPPMLYSGYVGFSIPFAFAIGALITRRVDAGWIRSTRRYALVAWTLLGIGILLGARWSYSELGWGGYWAWDPVENASLLPWLVGTAFLHSIIVQEKRGMLKIWNATLVIAAFCLALLGTFLVRSGILNSIHAFGESTLGVPFLIFISAVVLGSALLVISRLPDLRSENRIDALLSRESMFLLNNFVLVGLAATVFWGTFFPLISEAITGTKSSVGPPWFNQYATPLAIVLVLVTGLGPAIPWGKMSPNRLVKAFAVPVAAATATMVLALLLFDTGGSIPATLLFGVAAFSIVVSGREFVTGARARKALSGGSTLSALNALITRNRRRYGGYIIHIGIATLLIGVAASSAFNDTVERSLKPGQQAKVGDYTVLYVKPTSRAQNEKITFGAVLRVSKNGKHLTTLTPERSWFPANTTAMGPIGRYFGGEATSEVGLKAGLMKDFWTAVQPDLRALRPAIRAGNKLPGIDNPDVQAVVITAIAESYKKNQSAATFRMIANPMVTWMWIGGLIVIGGGLIALWPAADARRARVRSLAAQRLANASLESGT